MSATRLATRTNVRRLLRDEDVSGDPVVSSPQMNQQIELAMQEIASQLPLGEAWESAIITTTANDFTYTLPSSVEYHLIADLRLASQGWLLKKRSPSELEGLRQSNPVATGDPSDYALVENASQQVEVRLYPTPDGTDTIDALRGTVPATLATDATAIPFSAYALRALELMSAAALLDGLDDAAMAKLKLNRSVAARWTSEAARLIYWEKVRLNRQRRAA